jgi:hypothetical protein
MGLDLLQVSYLVKAIALVTAVALLWHAPPRPAPLCLIAVSAVLLVASILWRLFPELGLDYGFFWKVGRDVWDGADPYSTDHFAEHPFLNPPTALPLFALFALAPLSASFLVWTIASAVGCLLLLPLAQSTLIAQEQASAPTVGPTRQREALSATVVLGLIPALFVSDASLVGLYVGQLGTLEAVVLLAALHSQARGRPVLAGVCLAVATIKVTTLLPFLLLFLGKGNGRAWAALFLAVLALCLVTTSPAGLLERLTTYPERIKQLESPGQVNDYSFAGTRSENMLGFDHAFYRLGLRGPGTIRIAQYITLALLGGWVAFEVLRKDRLPRGAACSLVALYSVVFLYHRNYDTPVLALPFLWSAAQARLVKGRGRYLFIGCAVAILLVWSLDIGLLHFLQERSPVWGAWGRLIQAIVLPYATWLVVVAMAALVIGTRRSLGRTDAADPRKG